MENEIINGLNSFEKTFLYIAYADDTTFFLKDKKSVIELMKTFDIFLTFSGLKLSSVELALCGMECIDLIFNAIKILEVYHSSDKNLENLVLKIEKLLRFWRM